jgi:hypothetical protein
MRCSPTPDQALRPLRPSRWALARASTDQQPAAKLLELAQAALALSPAVLQEQVRPRAARHFPQSSMPTPTPPC